MKRYILQTIRWERYPLVAENPHAHQWLEIQSMLGLAQNTVHAYGRGANEYLAFCERTARPFIEATKADIVAYSDTWPIEPIPKATTSAIYIQGEVSPMRP